ncbi:MBL fold metallo-hydrolase [Alkalihalobacterium bogoriense]|uniref:MBL fold metallo-hydrolase n=1 Tax=Alkalihalobacterium bogoriense TaxID=246272 RepID=UPI0005556AAA|nr:MBL fold metallo-hydrolase [Alkalihalobacterium bogoriense]
MNSNVGLKSSNIIEFVLPTPFLVGPVNVYLVKSEALTLVDAGPKTEEAWESFTMQLKEAGYSPNDIEQIVVTHHHPDHVGLLDRFPNSRIIGHKNNEKWLKRDNVFLQYVILYFEQFYQENGLPQRLIEKIKRQLQLYMDFSCQRELDIIVKEGDCIDGLYGWSVVEVPGHAQSQIMLFNPSDKSAIAGDHLIQAISSNALLEAPDKGSDRPKPLLQYRKALQKLVDLETNIVYPGHGIPIKQAHELVTTRLKQQEKRAINILELLGDKEKNAFEIVQELFPQKYEKQADLTFSEVIGHLDLLEEENKITKGVKDSIVFYRQKK